MIFTNITPLKQNSKSQLMISFNQTTDKNNNVYDLEDCSKLANLRGNIILYGENEINSHEVDINKGNLLKSISVQLENDVNATVNDQTISLRILENNDEEHADKDSNSNVTDPNSKSSDSIDNTNDFRKQTDFNLKEFKIRDLTKSVQSQVISSKLDNDSNEETNASENENKMNSNDLANNINYLIPIAIVALLLLILIAFRKRNDGEDGN
jgi:hypothetical protein